MSQTAKNLKYMSYLVIIFAALEAIYSITSVVQTMSGANAVGTGRTEYVIVNGVLAFVIGVGLIWAALRLFTGIRGLQILKDKSVKSPDTLLIVLLVLDILSAISTISFIGRTADLPATIASAGSSIAYIIGDFFLRKYMKDYKAEA